MPLITLGNSSVFEFWVTNLAENYICHTYIANNHSLSDSGLVTCFLPPPTDNTSSTIIGWNIDGMRTNFDKVKLLVNRIKPSHNNVMSYVICETNVTEFEAQPFNLSGIISLF